MATLGNWEKLQIGSQRRIEIHDIQNNSIQKVFINNSPCIILYDKHTQDKHTSALDYIT